MTIDNRAYEKVPCRTCMAKGIKKYILINKTETCVECRSNPCKKCGTLTTSKKLLCFACTKPASYKRSVARKLERKQQRTGDE